jgi:hypothetical protein
MLSWLIKHEYYFRLNVNFVIMMVEYAIVLQVWDEMVAAGVKPNVVTFSEHIEALAKGEQSFATHQVTPYIESRHRARTRSSTYSWEICFSHVHPYFGNAC